MAVGLASWHLGRQASPAAGAAPTATGLARVVRADLVTSLPVPGTIGYGPVTVLAAPAGYSTQAVAAAQSAVNSAAQELAADRQAAADQAIVDQRAVAQAAADQRAVAEAQAQQREDQARALLAGAGSSRKPRLICAPWVAAA